MLYSEPFVNKYLSPGFICCNIPHWSCISTSLMLPSNKSNIKHATPFGFTAIRHFIVQWLLYDEYLTIFLLAVVSWHFKRGCFQKYFGRVSLNSSCSGNMIYLWSLKWWKRNIIQVVNTVLIKNSLTPYQCLIVKILNPCLNLNRVITYWPIYLFSITF